MMPIAKIIGALHPALAVGLEVAIAWEPYALLIVPLSTWNCLPPVNHVNVILTSNLFIVSTELERLPVGPMKNAERESKLYEQW